MKLNKFFAVAAASVLLITSCKEEDKNSTNPPANTKAQLALHFDHKLGNENFELNKDFVLSTGETVNFSFAKFYVSQITLMDDDGNANMMDKYLLIDPSVHHVDIGQIDPQHVHVIKFNVGVDTAANHLDPTTYEPSHPLAPQSPSMHWAWASGYIFFKLEGTVDTDSDGNVDDTFEYHIGLDKFLRTVSSTKHTDVAGGEELMVDVEVDYARFFKGVDLNLELSAHGMDDPGLSGKIADNAVKAIVIQ
jgi:hypothetical protein